MDFLKNDYYCLNLILNNYWMNLIYIIDINAKEKNPYFYMIFWGHIKTINNCINYKKIINTIYQPFRLIYLYLRDLNENDTKDIQNKIYFSEGKNNEYII